MRYKNIF